MIEIKFPADRPDIALALGQALTAIGTQTQILNNPAPAEDPKPRTSHTEALPPADTAAESASAEPVPKPTASTADAFTLPRPEETEAEPTGDALTAEPDLSAPLTKAADATVDLNGVAFDAAYCSEATEPFYTTGKMRGQWKKKRGVEQDDYDAWYAGQCEPVAAQEAPVNSAAAFGTQQPEPENSDDPADAGSLMVWVSEKQAAGLITQEDVNSAWGAAGVASPADLFGPDAGQAVAAVFQYLKAKV